MPAHPLSPFGTVAHLGPHSLSVRDAALMMNDAQAPGRARLDRAAARPQRLPRRPGRRHPRPARRVLAAPGVRDQRARKSPPRSTPRCAAVRGPARASKQSTRLCRPAGHHHRAVVPRRVDAVEHADAPAQQAVTDPDFRAEALLGERLKRLRDRPAQPAPRRVPCASSCSATTCSSRRPSRCRPFEARPPATRRSTAGHARLDAVLVSVQPHPAAGLHHPPAA